MADRSDIERAVRAYRARVAALEAAYHRAVGPKRREAAQRLQRETQRAIDELRADLDDTTDRLTRRWVANHPAFLRLEAAARAELDAVTVEAVRAIQWSIAEAAQLGPEATDAMVGAQLPDDVPVGGAFGQVNTAAVEQLVGALQASSPLRRLPGLADEAITGMQRELVRGLASGAHSRTIGRRIAQTTGMPAARAATIARTEIHRSYRESGRLAMQANPMVDQWRWVAALGARTCAACWAMHGTLHSVGEPMGTHPNCRCSQVPVVGAANLRALGIDPPPPGPTGTELFAQQPQSVQLQILGPDRFREFRRGRLTLADTVQTRTSREWGTTRTVASTRRATENAAWRRAEQPATTVPRPRLSQRADVMERRGDAWHADWERAHVEMAPYGRRPAEYLIDNVHDPVKRGRQWSHQFDAIAGTTLRAPDEVPGDGTVRWWTTLVDADGQPRRVRIVANETTSEIFHAFTDPRGGPRP